MSHNAKACGVTVSPAANTEIHNRVSSTCKMHWSQAKGRKYAALIIITHKTVMFVEK
jgi:hypothetical protein